MMKRLFKLRFTNILIGVGAATGAATYYFFNSPASKVHASWTTNYEPSFHAKWNENWDHRSPDVLLNPKKRSPDETKNGSGRAIRHLILIRHGQYNLDGKTDADRILTKLGRVQAEHTGHRLKELALPYTTLVKSTMSRAQETGSIISANLPDIPVSNCDLLREGAPIPPEPPLGSWKQEQYFYTDGARIEAAFRKYFHRADPEQADETYTILVCHANVIRYFVCRALQFPAEAWLRMSLNHASITWVSITPSGRVILRCLGDSGHMPPEHVTSR